MNGRARTCRGFTLVEVLLVIAIIGVLAGVFIFAIGGQQEKANREAAAMLVKQVCTALERYKLDVGHYPAEDEGGLEGLRRKPQFTDEKLAEKWAGPYLTSEPVDPWQNPISYQVTDPSLEEAQAVPYKVWSFGPNRQDDNGVDDDIRNKAWEDAEQSR